MVSSQKADVARLVDSDMSAESARMTALQVKQQLGALALSMANASSQNVLKLLA